VKALKSRPVETVSCGAGKKERKEKRLEGVFVLFT